MISMCVGMPRKYTDLIQLYQEQLIVIDTPLFIHATHQTTLQRSKDKKRGGVGKD